MVTQPVLEGTLTTPVNLIINMGDGNNAVAVAPDGVNDAAVAKAASVKRAG